MSGRRSKNRDLAALLLSVVLSGCTAPLTQLTTSSSPPSYACLLPGERRMLVAELFFARTIRGREPLSDTEWAEFTAQTITPNFPDGFTVFDGEGQWRNPQTGYVARDRTKIVLIAAKQEPDLIQRLSAVIDAYKVRFRQQTVGIITRASCAAF